GFSFRHYINNGKASAPLHSNNFRNLPAAVRPASRAGRLPSVLVGGGARQARLAGKDRPGSLSNLKNR
ncbi:hypothetical protein, partial [Massilia glaciei]|uniref:hypothetical protein n=1 Tax=Massilia glaciei TaxID=1524097 RepID=UPI001C62EF2E